MNKNKLYAFYGSLRPTMYNFEARADSLEVIKDNVEVKGYKMFSLGAYPFCVKTDNEDDKIIVTLCKPKNDAIEASIHRMEIGAGYYYDEITVDDSNYGIYLFDKAYTNKFTVDDGDWVKYKKSEAIAS